MTKEKKNMLSAIRFWAVGEGMSATANEILTDGFCAEKYGFKTTFITEFDKTREELLENIAKIKSDFIYVVTNDNAKRRELIKFIPDYCGILSYGNHFGLGSLYMVLREPNLAVSDKNA